MAVAVAVATAHPDSASSLLPKCLPFSLDTSCPIALPTRALNARPWPYAAAGLSNAAEESASSFLRRRYLETLYLSDILFPINHLVQDASGLNSSTPPNPAFADAIRPLLLTLAQVETRHRKFLLPLLTACIAAAANPSSDLAKGLVDDAMYASTLDTEEKDVLRVAMELMLKSRSVSEGSVVDARKLRGELEKRETLMQVALLFLYIANAPPAPPKKRKREKRRSEPPSVVDNPQAALEVLMDRLSVWSAISELESGPAIAENGTQVMLQAFWAVVIKPFFLSTQRDLCASFHLKVFATALPLDPILTKEAAPVKKSRKPTLTRARPSSDALTQPDFRPPDSRTISGPRSLSRAPSEAGTRRSTSRDRSLSRSLSARPAESLEMRRSRSKSIDPAPANDAGRQMAPKKGLMRAPSGGKDLFKGRQVGLMKRNSSLVARRPNQRDSQFQSQSQGSLGRSESLARVGLLGRKTSDPKGRRNSEENQGQSAQPGTLVYATPSKPKLADSIFGPRLGFVAPTPIREEPSSSERPQYIAETPHAFGRMSKAVDSGVAETPQTSTRSFVPSTGRSYAGMAINALNSIERVVGSDDESDLGDLMVMTDEEGDDD